jgi:hypothetical protein
MTESIDQKVARLMKTIRHCSNTLEDYVDWSVVESALHTELGKDAAAQAEPLTEDALLIEFGKLYPQDVGILELSKHNKDYALESIGARHHWTAFKAGARAIEAAHGIKGQP